jgi:hypothetical protein
VSIKEVGGVAVTGFKPGDLSGGEAAVAITVGPLLDGSYATMELSVDEARTLEGFVRAEAEYAAHPARGAKTEGK